jgi:FkbM family methyltransferase
MSPVIGVGRPYREPSWLERLGSRLRVVAAGMPLHGTLKRIYHAALGRVSGEGLMATLPGGECVRLDPAHRQLAWNADEYVAFKDVVRPGSIVLDAGANLGAYTVLFAQWVGPHGRVFAFEPAPECRAGLKRQLALNGVAARVAVRGEAVAGASGVRRFLASGLHGDNRLTAAGVPGDGIVVATTSIDDFCERERVSPDVMKIDVEGAELDVLRGARQTIARAGASLALFVELHPSLWPQFGITQADIESELRLQGLALERIDGPGDPWAIEGVCVRMRRAARPGSGQA